MKVAVNDFVRRQVRGSGKTYSVSLNFEEIAQHAQEQMSNGQYLDGYRDGVRVVQASREIISQFVCPIVLIEEETILEADVVKRRDSEEAYVQIRAITGEPLLTGAVHLICYRHDVLQENNEHSSEAEWELISLHAIPEGIDNFPMGPVTMMRNQLELSGGTAANYSSEEWRRHLPTSQ